MSNEFLTPSQQAAYDLIQEGHNVLITGEAGTGKSYLMNRIIEEYKKQNKSVVITASTGIAALQIHGQTMHSFFGIPLYMQELLSTRRPPIPDTLRHANLVIIDEISMVRIDVFEYVAKIILSENQRRISTGGQAPLQLILTGDFFQIPPVLRSDEAPLLKKFYPALTHPESCYAFKSQFWNALNLKTAVLTQPMRQDDSTMLAYLSIARWGHPAAVPYFNKCSRKIKDPEKNYIFLCGTNKKADSINQQKLEDLPDSPQTFYADLEGKFSPSEAPVPMNLTLKLGARVMITKNDPEFLYVNGTQGTITNMSYDKLTIEKDETGEEIVVKKSKWDKVEYVVNSEGQLVQDVTGSFTQFPVKLAWAITIHKSQGQTFENVELDPYSWSDGQLYVALSRVKSMDGLCLTRPIKPEYLKSNADVRRFYNIDLNLITRCLNEKRQQQRTVCAATL